MSPVVKLNSELMQGINILNVETEVNRDVMNDGIVPMA